MKYDRVLTGQTKQVGKYALCLYGLASLLTEMGKCQRDGIHRALILLHVLPITKQTPNPLTSTEC